jgi:hypothetical protein
MRRAAAITLATLGVIAGCAAPSSTAPRSTPVAKASEPPRPAAVAEPAATVAAAPLIPSPIRSVQEWDQGGGPGVLVRTERYALRLAVKDPVFRDRLPAYMEACSDAYARAIGPLPVPSEPMDLYVFASRGPWEAWTRKTLGRDADLYLGLGRGGFTTDGTSVLYDIGRVDTLTIMAHEGWHQFSQKSLREPLPTWLEEGLACWMEGTRMNRDGQPTAFRPWRNFERWNEARNAVTGERTLTLRELLETSPQECLEEGKDELLTYYAQAWALVHFLHDAENGRYREGLQAMVRDAAEGKLVERLQASRFAGDGATARRAARARTGPLALREYVEPNLDRLEVQYDQFLRDITRRGAGDRIFRGESPLTAPAGTAPATPPAK